MEQSQARFQNAIATALATSASAEGHPPYDFAVSVARRLADAGYVAYFAGGCVRDFLLGIEPKDFDVATNATPHQIQELFGSRRTLAIGAAFGVMCIVGNSKRGEGQVEVATFRRDGTYSDGRHPDSVQFSTPEMDAQRRDFTVNGMFLDPLQHRLIDYVGGERDLQLGVLRAIGSPVDRIAEDKLRMLRAIRFAARFGLEIEQETWSAIALHADAIQAVSVERISAELQKLIILPRATWAIERLQSSGLLAKILPELADPLPNPLFEAWVGLGGEQANSGGAKSASTAKSPSDAPTGLAALFMKSSIASPVRDLSGGAEPGEFVPASDDRAEKQLAAAALRLRFSNDQQSQARFAFKHAKTLLRATELPWSVIQPILIQPFARDALQLALAMANEQRAHQITHSTTSSQINDASIALCQQKLTLPADELDPPPLITGDDLRHAGFRPGPQFRQWLQAIRNAQLDGQITTPPQDQKEIENLLAKIGKITDHPTFQKGS